MAGVGVRDRQGAQQHQGGARRPEPWRATREGFLEEVMKGLILEDGRKRDKPEFFSNFVFTVFLRNIF